MSNEQKLREALLDVLGCKECDNLEDLRLLHKTVVEMAPFAPNKETAESGIKAALVLIETHPDNDQYVPFTTVEVGKTYKTRNGVIVTITGHSLKSGRPFKSAYGECYDKYGRVYGTEESCRDLVAVRS